MRDPVFYNSHAQKVVEGAICDILRGYAWLQWHPTFVNAEYLLHPHRHAKSSRPALMTGGNGDRFASSTVQQAG